MARQSNHSLFQQSKHATPNYARRVQARPQAGKAIPRILPELLSIGQIYNQVTRGITRQDSWIATNNAIGTVQRIPDSPWQH